MGRIGAWVVNERIAVMSFKNAGIIVLAVVASGGGAVRAGTIWQVTHEVSGEGWAHVFDGARWSPIRFTPNQVARNSMCWTLRVRGPTERVLPRPGCRTFGRRPIRPPSICAFTSIRLTLAVGCPEATSRAEKAPAGSRP